jgi:putative transposase
MGALRRSQRAVYDLKCHFVWIPKYRKGILTKEVAKHTKLVLARVAEGYGMIIGQMEIVEDQVHIILEAPPRLSPSRMVQILKSISARELFRQFPQLREESWAGQVWSDGYFVRGVGDEVTSDVIRRHIEYHEHQRDAVQLSRWDSL